MGRRPVGFLATTRPEVTERFYRETLGLTLLKHSPFALVFQDGTQILRVQIVSEFSPAEHTVHGWAVTDIATEIQHLTQQGVTCLSFDGIDQDASGIWTTPDGHKIAWFHDPCGNILSFTEYRSSPV